MGYYNLLNTITEQSKIILHDVANCHGKTYPILKHPMHIKYILIIYFTPSKKVFGKLQSSKRIEILGINF